MAIGESLGPNEIHETQLPLTDQSNFSFTDTSWPLEGYVRQEQSRIGRTPMP